MDKVNFDKVEVLLIDHDTIYRQALFGMLRGMGIRHIRQGATMHEIKTAFLISKPDLLICDAYLPDGNFCNFVNGLRHNLIGGNPFMPVLALTADPTGDLVKEVINSGSDDLLTKPLSATQLEDRIKGLVQDRKPFVVTSDYIGPTRRKSSDRESTIPLLDVPNTLREKATGKRPDTDIQQSIDEAIVQINLQKLERYGVQIVYLADHIVPVLLQGQLDDEVRQHIKRLNFVAGDTSRRMKGTKYDHVSDLCQTLIKVAKDIHAAGDAPSMRDIKLLKPLSSAIQGGFETGSAATAREIVASINE